MQVASGFAAVFSGSQVFGVTESCASFGVMSSRVRDYSKNWFRCVAAVFLFAFVDVDAALPSDVLASLMNFLIKLHW